MDSNSQLDLAWQFLEQTDTNIFLTGRAGTGKTTFLRNLKQHSPKRMIVVAPTGVAAINAGGVTIHSFFQLPFGPYLPSTQGGENGSLRLNFNKDKIAIIRSLDLLVIDEISMVRADMLDAVNDVLQRYRDRAKPFGGVQVLMIGDLQQLAPVIKPQEWALIESHYNSPYFFDSKALKATDYLTLELQHVYRQSDSQFIDILNRVRDNDIDSATLNKLNSRYIANFEPDSALNYITLTSHNAAARQINEQKMASLATPAHTFTCHIEGNFPDHLYPSDGELTLKEGAQVMFIKNDTSGQQRYFNGKIGQVTRIEDEQIEVTLPDSDEPILVELAEWTNIKYTLNAQTQQISEVVDGVFHQFPLKAAWAITIHKSQGLTFDRAIIDAADSFSHGQVYVALSRCRTFEGIILSTALQSSAIMNDAKIKAYNESSDKNEASVGLLSVQSRLYYASLLVDMFNFAPLKTGVEAARKVFGEQLNELYPKLSQMWNEAADRFCGEVLAVSYKFHTQLNGLIASTAELGDNEVLAERITKAQTYFLAKCNEIFFPLVESSSVVVDNKEKRKLLRDALCKLREQLTVKLAVLAIDNTNGFSIHNYLDARAKATLTEQKAKRERVDKPEKISLDVSVADIENVELFEHIRSWRKEISERDNVPVYFVMHQKTLVTVCTILPRNNRELLSIKGVGKRFVDKYGEQLLAIIQEWVDGKV